MRTDETRFVIDTNVLVSALIFPDSLPEQAVRLTLVEGIVLASAATLEELRHVLRRPKFSTYLSLPECDSFLERLAETCSLIEPTERVTLCSDPKDNKCLELALAGGAHWLVTGDRDLLEIGHFRGTTILTSREFLARG
jgi:uncharacterized protein